MGALISLEQQGLFRSCVAVTVNRHRPRESAHGHADVVQSGPAVPAMNERDWTI